MALAQWSLGHLTEDLSFLNADCQAEGLGSSRETVSNGCKLKEGGDNLVFVSLNVNDSINYFYMYMYRDAYI